MFRRVDGFPFILTVSKGVDDIVASSTTKAIAPGIVTLLICAALMGLTVLFRRESRRRTRAEAAGRNCVRQHGTPRAPAPSAPSPHGLLPTEMEPPVRLAGVD